MPTLDAVHDERQDAGSVIDLDPQATLNCRANFDCLLAVIDCRSVHVPALVVLRRVPKECNAMSQLTYIAVIEKSGENFGAYVPDLPGCIAVGGSVEEVTELIREAVQFHLEGLVEEGAPIPPPASRSIVVQAEIAA